VDQATGDAVATATNGMAFAGGATEKRYPLPTDNGIICAAPVDPEVTQSTGCEVEGTLTVPATEGVVYALDGKTVAPGTYAGPLSGTLTATVLAGYENTDAYWTFEVDIPAAPSCLEVPAQPAELDVCNPGNVTNNVKWDTFPTLENVAWSVDEVTGEAVATAINGAAFGPGVTEVRFQPSADSGEECTLEPGAIESTCVDAVPYLSYALILEEGYVGPTDVTITFVNPSGKDYVVTGQPLSGKLLWPGASVDPAGWPGWVRNPDGSYTETTGNYAWTRDGVKVTFEVNPHYELVVAYPQATTACANPQQPETGPETHDGPKTDGPKTHAAPKTHDGVLPNTGAPSGSGLYGVVGGLFVVLGAWLMMRERRRRA
ncbi:LPXTG cell wall anchor domain-containing protein, partial [Nocardioides sp. Soil796]|uniref:LPXTG cell wall anchor domain-containing protein n=1 Tax=Nocardioides sp. Soil796 TaxID=1736412 RepID=UPI00070F302C